MADTALREEDPENPLTRNEIRTAVIGLLGGANQGWDNLAPDVPFQNDAGDPIQVGTLRDWAAEFDGSSKYGALVAEYDLLTPSGMSEAQLRMIFDTQFPDARTPEEVGELWAEDLLTRIGFLIDPTTAPPAPADADGLGESDDEDQEAINANARRSDAALAEQAKQALSGSTGTSTADSFAFKEQCFLASKMVDIIKYKDKTISRYKKLPYVQGSPQTNDTISNACILVHDDPFHFINRLLVYPDTEEYFDMRTEDIANLQPEIRFFKTVFNEQTGENINTEIRFETTTDVSGMLVNKRKRATGTGIKQFDISFIGTDPFAAKKDLRATLKIYTSSMEELFKVRGSSGIPYRYIDLALKTVTTKGRGKTATSSVSQASTENSNMPRAGSTIDDVTRMDFAIKAKVGVRKPTKTVAGTIGLMSAIERNSVTVQMTPVTHEFNFQPNGSLEFVIHYVPFIADHFNTSTFDILGGDLMNSADLNRKIEMKMYENSCDDEMKEKMRLAHIANRREAREKKLPYLIKRLHLKQQIHYLSIPPSVAKAFNKDGPAADISAVFGTSKKKENNEEKKTEDEIKHEAELKKAADDAANIVIKSSAGTPVSVQENNIPYFYLGDIVDVAMENIETTLKPNEQLLGNLKKKLEDEVDTGKSSAEAIEMWATDGLDVIIGDYISNMKESYESYKKYRVILGPLEIVDPTNPKKVIVASLGDIPISLRYFQEFLTHEILSNDRTRMPLAAFLQKLIQKMLRNFLNNDTCFGGAVKHKARLNKTEAVCYNNDSRLDDLTKKIKTARYNAIQVTKGKVDADDKIPVVDRLMADYYRQPLLKPVGFGGEDLINGKPAETYNYLIFYASRTSAIRGYQGNREEDGRRGVHHYSVGRDQGIIKNIKLNRDKRPMMKEARFEAEGYDGLQQLREVYNVNIDCYANFNIFPGAKIYVDGTGWVPTLDADTLAAIGSFDNLTELGIGGYYDVTKVEHSFGPGTFNTSFTAYWTNGIGEQARPPGGSPIKKEKSKCKSSVQAVETDNDASSKSGASKSEDINAARNMALDNPNMLHNIADAMGLGENSAVAAVAASLGQGDALGAARGLFSTIFSSEGVPSANTD